MAHAVVVLAEGFEEIEAVTPVDVLRRAGVEVTLAGVGGRRIRGARGVVYEADCLLEAAPRDADLLVLPGGMPGASNLAAAPAVGELVHAIYARGGRVAAICAAPAVALAPLGLLEGKRATCYPGFEERFGPGVERASERVVVDGRITTSRGPGTALEFALSLVEQLVSAEAAAKLRAGMLVGS